jgi:uncharacterized damage-inducible protein DinB
MRKKMGKEKEMHDKKLIDSLESNSDILERFIQQISEDSLHRKRGEGIWTVHEHLHHLALVQPVMFKRIRLFKNGGKPVIKPYVPGPEEEKERTVKRPVAELVRTFRDWRNKQVELARSCGPEAWEKTGEHPEYDQYSLEILLRHILAHDGWHMYRMEEIWLAKDEVLTK